MTFLHPRYRVQDCRRPNDLLQNWKHSNPLNKVLHRRYPKKASYNFHPKLNTYWYDSTKQFMTAKTKLDYVKENHIHFVYEQEDFNRERDTCLYPKQYRDWSSPDWNKPSYIYGPFTRILKYSWDKLYKKRDNKITHLFRREIRGVSYETPKNLTKEQYTRKGYDR